MQNVIKLTWNEHEFAHIVMIELEVLQFEKVLDVHQISGNQVVHAHHFVTLANETIAQVGTEETGSTGYEYSFFSCFSHVLNQLRTGRPMLS